MSTNHPRYNARMRRSFAECLRVIEALQAGQSILIERHANGVRIRHPHPQTDATAPPTPAADAASQTPSGST